MKTVAMAMAIGGRSLAGLRPDEGVGGGGVVGSTQGQNVSNDCASFSPAVALFNGENYFPAILWHLKATTTVALIHTFLHLHRLHLFYCSGFGCTENLINIHHLLFCFLLPSRVPL